MFDIHAFWRENRACDKPFSTDKPRAPLVFIMEDHFITHLIEMPSTVRYYTDPAYALLMNERANDLLEREIGLRPYPQDGAYYVKGAFEVVMGARRVLREGNTPWLEPAAEGADGVRSLIRRAERMDMKAPIPDAWREEKAKLARERGKRLRFAHGMNGPATMACNLLGTQNACLLMMDEPELMEEFFAVVGRRYIEFQIAALLEDEGEVRRCGTGVNDDICYVFPPAQYERFCAPLLAAIFAEFAPHPGHKRRQHSDSAMGHLMGILWDLGVNEVNFGPEIHPADIRRALPGALIHGHTPPFVLRNGTPGEIAACVRRNFVEIGADGGYAESLAGVVPESTPLANIRAYMRAVSELTRY